MVENTNIRAEQLQFLRFIAFVVICNFHIGGMDFLPFSLNSAAVNAVAFFFILSGFGSGYTFSVLYASGAPEVTCNLKTVGQYLWQKLKRFYPLYFIITVITAVLALDSPAQFVKELPLLLRHLSLLQSWFPDGHYAYTGVGRFLSTIMFLYVLNIPLKALAAKEKKAAGADWYFLLIAVVLYGVICGCCYLTRNTNTGYTQYILAVARVGEYVCGMALACFAFPHGQRSRLKPRAQAAIYTVAEIAVLFLWFLWLTVPRFAWQSQLANWLIPNCLLLVVFAQGKGALSRLFKMNFLRYLGDISYECFLLHQIVIVYLYRFCEDAGLGITGGTLGFSLLCITVTVLLSMLFSRQKLRKGTSQP